MSLIKRATKVTLEGVGALTLRTSDYLTQGGEGAIYRNGNRIIKLYLDPNKITQSGMVDKVGLLARELAHPSIIAPSGMVLGSKGQPIGYYMPEAAGEPYPRLFTNDFWKQTGFNEESVKLLTEQMREVVDYAHDKQALLCDANELNWIGDVRSVQKPVPYVIDVDSWQIDRFKASVIMPSIRDWHSGGFSQESDWFAWGIVSFLLFTGTHPYKGKLDGYKIGELERRMKDNASVFLPEVRLNRAVRDFSLIPGPLLDWYQETFTKGHRGPPPSPLQTGNPTGTFGRVMRTVATATGGLIYEELLRITNDPIVSVWPCGVVKTAARDLYRVRDKRKIGRSDASRLAVVERPDGYLLAEALDTGWSFRFLSHRGAECTLSVQLPVDNVFRSAERLFAASGDQLFELNLQHFAKPILSVGMRWQIMGGSTKWYRGVGVSDVLGAMHLVLPYNEDALTHIKVPELDGKRILGAVAGTRFVEVMTITPAGEYEALGFAFESDYKRYSMSVRTCESPEQNLAILNKGVTAGIHEDGELIVAVPFKGEQKVVQDKDLATTMRLSNIGDRVVYRSDDALYALRMR